MCFFFLSSPLIICFSAILSLLSPLSQQNNKLCSHLKAFWNTNFQVWSLLKGAVQEPEKVVEYTGAARAKAGEDVTWVLLLLEVEVLSLVVTKFKRSLEGLKKDEEQRGSK